MGACCSASAAPRLPATTPTRRSPATPPSPTESGTQCSRRATALKSRSMLTAVKSGDVTMSTLVYYHHVLPRTREYRRRTAHIINIGPLTAATFIDVGRIQTGGNYFNGTMANLKIVTEVLPTANSVPAGRKCVQSSTPILPLTTLHECRPVCTGGFTTTRCTATPKACSVGTRSRRRGSSSACVSRSSTQTCCHIGVRTSLLVVVLARV